jgi:hypothetical protein
MGQLKYWLGRLQAPTEPGLTTAQLMLTNDDLRPGESHWKKQSFSMNVDCDPKSNCAFQTSPKTLMRVSIS